MHPGCKTRNTCNDILIHMFLFCKNNLLGTNTYIIETNII